MGDHGRRRKLQIVHEGAEIRDAVTKGEGLVFVEFIDVGLDNLLSNALAECVRSGIPLSGHNEIPATQKGEVLGSCTGKSMAKG